jgi:hypothetical protein
VQFADFAFEPRSVCAEIGITLSLKRSGLFVRTGDLWLRCVNLCTSTGIILPRSILVRQALIDLSLPISVLFPYCFIFSMLASILFVMTIFRNIYIVHEETVYNSDTMHNKAYSYFYEKAPFDFVKTALRSSCITNLNAKTGRSARLLMYVHAAWVVPNAFFVSALISIHRYGTLNFLFRLRVSPLLHDSLSLILRFCTFVLGT